MQPDLHRRVPSMTLRDQLTDIIERAIAMLDQVDGDADFKIETDQDLNPVSLQAVDRVPAKRVTMRRAAHEGQGLCLQLVRRVV